MLIFANLAPPKLSKDEYLEANLNKSITLNCEVNNLDEKTSITWLFVIFYFSLKITI